MTRPDDAFMEQMASLEDAYLAMDDPIEQSGFSGGAIRWEAERRPILEAVTGDGDLLDVGCANGHLLSCLVAWAAERGLTVTPHGLDLGSRLISHARTRLPEHADHLHVGDVWTWQPRRSYDYAYTLIDLAPADLVGDLLHRVASWVTPGGRLIVGDYGSRSRGISPRNMGSVLRRHGFNVAGTAIGGNPPVSAFAWADIDRRHVSG